MGYDKRQLSGEEISELASQISSSHKDNENEGSNSLFVGHDIALL